MKNLETLYAKYKDKFLVLKDENVESAHDDLASAYKHAISKFKPGEFSIQECKSNKREGYIEVFNSSCVWFGNYVQIDLAKTKYNNIISNKLSL